jgi:serine phosphatase RsbU (regulator of sigma subunit)
VGFVLADISLLSVVSAHRDLPAQELVARVVADVKGFSRPDQSDDWTLIVARGHETGRD